MGQDDDDDDDGWFGLLWSAWWTRLLLGLALAGAGVYIYVELAAREARGGTIRMPAVFIAVYEALGKGGILAVFAVLGLACVASAVASVIKSRAARRA